MSHKTALESLEAALRLAEEREDEMMTLLIAGLIEEARALRNDLADLGRKVAAVESQIKHLR